MGAGNGSHLYKIPSSIPKALKSLCKIEIGNTISSGFFIKFFKNEEDFFCLMTNEHIIKKEMINQGIKINIYYDNEEKVKEIELNTDERFIKDFTDIIEEKNIDATVIEILPTDKIDTKLFLIPSINYMYKYDNLIDKEVIVLQYPGGVLGCSSGLIKYIKNYEFTHLASTEFVSSGSPIFLKDNIKIIGIHKSGKKDKTENYGDFIGPIFQYFKNFSKNNKKEGISKEDISKNKDDDNKKNSLTNNKLNQITMIYKAKDNKCNKVIYENEDKEIKSVPGRRNYEIWTYGAQGGSERCWESRFRIFGRLFVENNKNKCYLLIGNEKKN